VARFDKYDPISGGFRAPLNADLTLAAFTALQTGNPVGVTLNASGRVIVGGPGNVFGDEDIHGLLVIHKTMRAGQIVDVMTSGEIVEMTGQIAGDTLWISNTTGLLDSTPPAIGVNKVRAGFTVEATRLVVRCQTVQGGA
jgi:hypothetical protein